MGLLLIKPYSKITVTELCRLADINRGTFYIHYFDVDDVLDDIVTESNHRSCTVSPKRNLYLSVLPEGTGE